VVKLAVSACPSRMDRKLNIAAADIRILDVGGAIKANRRVASKLAAKKKEALGIIVFLPTERQANSPF